VNIDNPDSDGTRLQGVLGGTGTVTQLGGSLYEGNF
jgi:hypothetical protein